MAKREKIMIIIAFFCFMFFVILDNDEKIIAEERIDISNYEYDTDNVLTLGKKSLSKRKYLAFGYYDDEYKEYKYIALDFGKDIEILGFIEDKNLYEKDINSANIVDHPKVEGECYILIRGIGKYCGEVLYPIYYVAGEVGEMFYYKNIKYVITKKGYSGRVDIVGYRDNIEKAFIPEDIEKNGYYKVTNITKKAFFGCKSLKKLKISCSISIDKEAFSGCNNLRSVIIEYHDKGKVSISKKAFFKCKLLKNVKITTVGFVYVGEKAFSRCNNLKMIKIDAYNGNIIISNEAFSGCKNLIDVNPFANIFKVEKNCFKNTSKRLKVHIPLKKLKEGIKLFENKGNKNLFLVYEDNILDYKQTKKQTKIVNKKVSKIIKKIIKKNMSSKQKVKVIHDWVVNHITYDDSMTRRSAYDGLILKEHKVVCQGYAIIMKIMLDEAGIQSHYVTGITTNSKGKTGLHAWNIVKIGEKWYHIDATWDDPQDYIRYDYFLVGENTINKDHTMDKEYLGCFTISKEDYRVN